MSRKPASPAISTMTSRLATGLSAVMLVLLVALAANEWFSTPPQKPEKSVQDMPAKIPQEQAETAQSQAEIPAPPVAAAVAAAVAQVNLPPAPAPVQPSVPDHAPEPTAPETQPAIPTSPDEKTDQTPSQPAIAPLQPTKRLPDTRENAWEPLGKTARRNPKPAAEVPTALPAKTDLPTDKVDFAALRKRVRNLDQSRPQIEPAPTRAKTKAKATPPARSGVGPTERKPPAKMLAADKDRATEQQGRILLNLLEHGDGPGIHIDWPADSRDRDRLYMLFSQCLGMKSALWAEPAVIYDNNHPRGQGIAIDSSRYSLFLRAPSGSLPQDEKALLRRIERRHGAAADNARPARLFPRKLDAILLGGLQKLAGPEYKTAKSIHAAWRVRGQQIHLENIRLDGQLIPGSLRLASGPFYHCTEGRV